MDDHRDGVTQKVLQETLEDAIIRLLSTLLWQTQGTCPNAIFAHAEWVSRQRQLNIQDPYKGTEEPKRGKHLSATTFLLQPLLFLHMNPEC